jgi:histone arginine demethylase JMJD6
LDHIHCKDFDVPRFEREFESKNKPCVISGLADQWAGRREWTLQALSEGPYRQCRMKCGEDDDGYSIKIKMKYFMQYLHQNKDDSPLYLFDSSYDENSAGASLLRDYKVPPYFAADLFALVGDKRRPPHRWFLVGPERSGSSLHIDPLGTSAWNTLISGMKLWVLFDPAAPKKLVKGEHLKHKGEDNEAITYFSRILPRIAQEEERKAGGPSLGMMMFVQYPGQTVFVPGGWWHAVINLEPSVAVTQNFCSAHNFPVVWRKARKGRKHMARRWLEALKDTHPKLHEQALAINKEDKFEWVFSERKKKKKSKKSKKGKSKKDKSQRGDKNSKGKPVEED